MAIISGLYKIVDQQCTAPQIAELLKKYKDINKHTKEEIRVSGPKPALLENLERVVSLNMIPKTDVYSLIQESEENGQQHIYFFRPKGVAADRCGDATEIADLLFDEAWGEDYFPQFDRRTEKLKWADFRIGYEGKAKDWLGKLYGHERILKLKNRQRQDVSATHFREILDYEAEDYNTVLVVRWNRPGLLEIRIDQTGLQKAGAAEDRLEKVWGELDAAVKMSECEPWDLRPAITTMLQDRAENEEIYVLGTVRMLDAAHGAIQFDPYSPTEDIDTDEGRTAAINDLLNNDAKGTKASVIWKPHEDCPELKKPLLTALTGENFNCLVVSSKTSASIVDYVTNRLREFS